MKRRSTFVSNFIMLAALALSLSWGALAVTPVYAVGITVNTFDDELNADGDCSLREAIKAANLDSAVDACPAGLGADVISLPAGTYTLSLAGAYENNNATGDLDIDSNITINGAGPTAGDTIIQAGTNNTNGIDRVFEIRSGVATLNLLTIRYGRAVGTVSEYGNGGGISVLSGATLSILESHIFNNSSTFTDFFYSNGGGIHNEGTLTIRNSAISGNTSQNNGGGLYTTIGTALIVNSTIADNVAENGVGGIYIWQTSTVTLKNNTISGNMNINGLGAGGIYNYGTLHMSNNIIANSSTSDCGNVGSLGTNLNNLVENFGCSSTFWGDPGLSALADNGGKTFTMAISSASPAIDAGDDTSCAEAQDGPNNLDQRGESRLQGEHCDIGAYEYVESNNDAPVVSSIETEYDNPYPTDQSSIVFFVTFSKPVMSVGAADFAVTRTGNITGMTIASVTGSGNKRTVTVNTGAGSGTLRLDVRGNATITDQLSNALTGIPFTTGEIYPINKTYVFKSQGANDGWILESTSVSGQGGTKNQNSTTLNIGDDAGNKQYRSVLSFNTSDLSGKIITRVVLKVKRAGMPVGGGNPIATFGGFRVDIKKGSFGTSALALTDFSALASKTYGPFSPALNGGWYTITLTTGKSYINKTGLTQIRLRFNLEDNNNAIANYLTLYSGNAASADRPQLIVDYNNP